VKAAVATLALAAAATVVVRGAARADAQPAAAARLATDGQGRTRLTVGGRPFLLLGGELGNSSASSFAFAKPLLARLPALGLNTVLLPVSWELIEPEEGRFDLALVGDLVREARRDRLHVVLLWFGSWKNGMSSAVPAWVKRDQKRFPRAEATPGRGVESLSPFSDASRDADARAFAALMRYVRKIDAREGTVVMVQVENEVAMIDAAADHGPAAAQAFRAPVPAEVLRAAPPPGAPARAGSWEDVYGKGPATEERFMAWHYARYVDAVARAGKAEHPLPMFVNAALNRPGQQPGQYPSAGPLPHVFEMWKAGAPTVELLAPDIYFPDFAAWCERYARPGNALFVPEARNGPESGVHALYAFGLGAIGFSPFAIDTIPAAGAAALRPAYALLADLAPLLLAGGARTAGVLVDKDAPAADVALGGYKLHVVHDYTWQWSSPARNDPTWPRAGALVIALADDEYLIAGNGVIVTFAPATPGDPVAGIERIDEGRVEGGKFVVTRRLNGDETHQGRHLRLPAGSFGLQRVKLYRYR
jgi:beta-galactosidase GanA